MVVVNGTVMRPVLDFELHLIVPKVAEDGQYMVLDAVTALALAGLSPAIPRAYAQHFMVTHLPAAILEPM